MKRICFLLPAILLVILATFSPAGAEPPAPAGLQLRNDGTGVSVFFRDDPNQPVTTTQIFALLPDQEPPQPQITHLQREAWFGPLPQTRLPARSLPDGTHYEARTAAEPLPAAPLSLLRETWLHGRLIAIYAVNQIYREDEQTYRVLNLQATIPASALFEPAQILTAPQLRDLELANSTVPSPQAARSGWEITVRNGGMQVLESAQLAAAGLDPQTTPIAHLQLYRGEEQIALEEVRNNGTLQALRFYAPPPRDRYDPVDRYWLFVESSPGTRMIQRDARPNGSAMSSSAIAEAEWYAPVSYDSRLPGSDGDHFFSADLRTAPLVASAPNEPAVISFTLSLPLPPASGETVVEIDGASLFDQAHRLQVSLGATTREAVWSGEAVWAFQMRFPAFPAEATVRLLPGVNADGVHVNRVRWVRPVDLRFAGKGALFTSREGAWTYDLRETPAGATLYDLSDPANPQRLLTQVAGNRMQFSATTAQPYLLAGPGTLVTPEVAPRVPLDLQKLPRADGIYLAPQIWLERLEPLLALRRAQGHGVVAVPVEAVYAGWSGGRVSPEAIRAFLRYAAANWSPPPQAVTLVGDGTSDPYNYFGTGWTNWIPPYLLPVDPWLGETACETCYVQLDGISPLDDLLPDLAIGRLPVKSATELDQMIAKIVGYEQSTAPGRWRGRVAYIADNADLAGDFGAVADASAARLPPGVQVARVYYDPDPPPDQPWRERDPLAATANTLTTFDAGAGVLVYLGHGLQFQWAVTGPPLGQAGENPPNYLLNVDSARDTRNQLRLPITLTMTCLSSAFQIPSFRGTTIDEALLLHNEGGAIAVLGSSGLGVLYGHEALMRGFFATLWREGGMPTVGEVTLGAYAHLAANSPDADAVRSFVLLGDPLTQPQLSADAAATTELNLPVVLR